MLQIAKYYGDGKSESGIEHQMRKVRGWAEAAKGLADGGADPFRVDHKVFLGVKDTTAGRALAVSLTTRPSSSRTRRRRPPFPNIGGTYPLPSLCVRRTAISRRTLGKG